MNYRISMNFNNGIQETDADRAEAHDTAVNQVQNALTNVIGDNWQNIEGVQDGDRVRVTFTTPINLTQPQRQNIIGRCIITVRNVVSSDLVEV